MPGHWSSALVAEALRELDARDALVVDVGSGPATRPAPAAGGA
ncbi:hypothetical protein [Streptomyces sp. NPDC002573]